MKSIKVICLLIFCSSSFGLQAQENNELILKKNYLGILPSFLVEPYDTIDALEVNIFPLVYERRFENNLAFQVRPILNYRFYESAPGISQVGATVMLNKYFTTSFSSVDWLYFVLGGFYTYTYNNLDLIHTMTLGVEPGLFMKISDQLSMNVNIQPGINYYPDEYSQEFVETKSGFKSHFGVMFHLGYNF